MAEDLRRSEQEIRAVWDSEVFQAVSKTNGVQAIDWDLMWGLPPHKIFSLGSPGHLFRLPISQPRPWTFLRRRETLRNDYRGCSAAEG